jgi:hypothetical protein
MRLARARPRTANAVTFGQPQRSTSKVLDLVLDLAVPLAATVQTARRCHRDPAADQRPTAAQVGAERSNPFTCSRYLPYKLSPPISAPRKSPTAAGIRATRLGFGERNVPANCSPNADLSPELESRPFYSTGFFTSGFSGLASLANRKVGIPFAGRIPRWLLPTAVDTAPTLHNQHYRPS